MNTAARLLTFLIVTILAIVVVVVMVGGIVCITNDRYDFAAYMRDLTAVYKLLLTAVLGILGRALLPVIEKRANGSATG